MKTKIVASSFVRRKTDTKYLILRRSATDVSRKGEWDLAGGLVDEAETIREGALREVAEETGLHSVLDCRLLFSVSGVSYSPKESADVNYVFLYYVLDVEGLEEVSLSFEHDSYLWVNKNDMKDYLTHRAQIAAYNHIFNHSLDVAL